MSKNRPPENQLALIELVPVPIKEKPRTKKPDLSERVEQLEKRVTHLEADLTLLTNQLEQEYDDEL